ncbi:MAG: hypothetical protein K6G94_03935 [Kiritimatiellae bacterium]|nr:hypothetical protein [Kiritimatiellia bacterium]
MKRIIFIVALSVALAPIFCSGTDYYVDSQAASSGDGTQASPFATIQEGVDAASSGDTVYLKGSLYVSQASQCVVIPAGKPELTLSNWGGGRFSIEVDNDFMKNMENKASTNIINICSQSNTISGIEFVYHKNSLGQQYYGKGSCIFFFTNYQTVADCRFYRPGNEATPGYAGVDRLISGQSWGGDKNNSYGQSYMTIRNCIFENTFGFRGDTHKYPIGVGDYATIANCVFSNCWAIAASIQNGKFNNYTIVSNVLILAAMDTSKYLAPAEQHAGVFTSAFGGMGKGEIAYNVFIGQNRDFALFNYGRNDGFNSGKISFHHNTVIGFAYILSGGRTNSKDDVYGDNKALFEFADNIIDANVLFYENATNAAHQASAIKSGSVLWNNAVCLTNNDLIATGAAAKSAMYNLFDKLSISNNVFLASLPEFVETNDINSADFYRPRLRLGQDADLRRIGWTGENNEYPRFVGAREPIAPGLFTIHLQ